LRWRAVLLGLLAMLVFGLFEQWPARLPAWLARWALATPRRSRRSAPCHPASRGRSGWCSIRTARKSWSRTAVPCRQYPPYTYEGFDHAQREALKKADIRMRLVLLE
jgi:hypothetical protein